MIDSRLLKILDEPYSLDNYKRLLMKITDNGYIFSAYDKISNDDPTVILRHDIDDSIEYAHTMAEINASMGVSATFFVLIRTNAYNPFSFESIQLLKDIISMQQRLGIHIAIPPNIRGDTEKINSLILQDYYQLRSAIPDLDPVFAWHNPKDAFPNLSESKKNCLVGFTNADCSDICGIKPLIVTDSNFLYTVRELEEIFEQKHHAIQLLIHPMQWVHNATDMTTVMILSLLHHIKGIERDYLSNLIYSNRYPNGISTHTYNHIFNIIKSSALSEADILERFRSRSK
jgi:hypothetical protein